MGGRSMPTPYIGSLVARDQLYGELTDIRARVILADSQEARAG
jgi:hypothetical protein